MTMPGRSFAASATTKYRYGFNGQEKSDEIFEGSTTALFWEYDSRTGRRWNVDPVLRVWESPYLTMGGNPTSNKDPYGDDWVRTSEGKMLFDSRVGNASDAIKFYGPKVTYIVANRLNGTYVYQASDSKKMVTLYVAMYYMPGKFSIDGKMFDAKNQANQVGAPQAYDWILPKPNYDFNFFSRPKQYSIVVEGVTKQSSELLPQYNTLRKQNMVTEYYTVGTMSLYQGGILLSKVNIITGPHNASPKGGVGGPVPNGNYIFRETASAKQSGMYDPKTKEGGRKIMIDDNIEYNRTDIRAHFDFKNNGTAGCFGFRTQLDYMNFMTAYEKIYQKGMQINATVNFENNPNYANPKSLNKSKKSTKNESGE